MAIPITFDGVIASVSANAPPTYDAAGFADAGVSYTTVGQLINFPDVGRVYTDVAYNSLDVRGTRHIKGTYEEPEIPLELGVVRLDDGQIILKTASDSDASFTFKFEYSNGEVDYFQAKVFSLVSAGGDGDTIRAITANVRIDHQGVISVAA